LYYSGKNFIYLMQDMAFSNNKAVFGKVAELTIEALLRVRTRDRNFFFGQVKIFYPPPVAI
jgi:hypothetical protein